MFKQLTSLLLSKWQTAKSINTNNDKQP